MAFVTFPLSLFASIFGMNTKTLPLAGFEGDFWIILGIMVAATIFFFAFFKHKRWL
jgi:Mg2+ and Co2+ transporter CorA